MLNIKVRTGCVRGARIMCPSFLHGEGLSEKENNFIMDWIYNVVCGISVEIFLIMVIR